MTTDQNHAKTLTITGKICALLIAATLLSLVLGWIAVTGEPNPHGHPGHPELNPHPPPWTVVVLNIAAYSGMGLFVATLICSLLILGKKKNPPSKKERSIAQWTLFMPILLFIHAIILPPVMCYRCDTRSGLCQNNLRLIEHAKGVLAVKQDLKDGDVVEKSEIAVFIKSGFPVCPANGEYSINPIGIDPICSVGYDHKIY